jgi:hypothetical protein
VRSQVTDRNHRFIFGLLALAGTLLLAACGSQAWKRDPDIQAAKAACRGPEGEQYACVERHAIDTLNPDVCRLAGIWVDDMCLQAVYEAADDPTVCEQLYLEGVRPTCRAYYAASRTPSLGPTPFRSDVYHLEVSLPHGWVAVQGPELLARPFTGLVAFNSWAEPGFWAPALTSGEGSIYSPQSTLGQAPEGGAYVVLVHFSGGPPMLPEAYGPEYERVDLGRLWTSQDCRAGDGATWIEFYKWGRFLRLEVYCHPAASDATAAAVNDLLATWTFDRVPAGNAGWATTLARSFLPPAAHPEEFPLLNQWPVGDEPLQTSMGYGDAVRITEAEVAGRTVVVTFLLRWSDPSLGASGDRCPPNRCHWWRFEVRPDGELVMLEEGGAALLTFSMSGAWLRYSNPLLGFSAQVPGDWEVTGLEQQLDAEGRAWTAIECLSPDYALGYPPLDQYRFTVAMAESTGKTLTETVEVSLSTLVPTVQGQIERHCCLSVGGERAMELLGFPPTRWGSRQLLILHDGREYRLTFYPQMGISAESEAGIAAQHVVETFLRTFAFVPITVAPTLPAPTITPVPTPTIGSP